VVGAGPVVSAGTAVRATGLRKVYGVKVVLDDVDLLLMGRLLHLPAASPAWIRLADIATQRFAPRAGPAFAAAGSAY
jgi:hypothetical protein